MKWRALPGYPRHLLLRILVVGVLCHGGIDITRAQNASELFQEALLSERMHGDLRTATRLYEVIVTEHQGDRSLSAKALLRLGLVQEKMGSNKAAASYERLISDYPEQGAEVARARERLAYLAKTAGDSIPHPVVPVLRELALSDVFAPLNDLFGAAVSRDGRLLANKDWSTGDIAIQNLTTGAVQRLGLRGPPPDLSRVYAEGKAFSSDGRKLAYVWFSEDSTYSLRIRDLKSGRDRILVEPTRGQNILYSAVEPREWSSDDKLLLAQRRMGDTPGQSDIVVVDVESGDVQFLHSISTGWSDNSCFLDGGRIVAFDQLKAQQRDVYLLDVATREVTALLTGPTEDVVLGCRDDKLIVGSGRKAGYAAYLVEDIEAADPELTYLVDIPQDLLPIGLSSEGGFFYGKREERDLRMHAADVDFYRGRLTSAPSLLDRIAKRGNSIIGWSRAGDSFAFKGSDQEIIVEEHDLRRVVRPNIQMAANSPIWWMPDGGAFLIGRPAYADLPPAAFVVGAVSGAVRDSVSGVIALGPGPDGRSLYHLVKKNKLDREGCVYIRALSTGEERLVYCGPYLAYSSAHFSPDGEQFALKIPPTGSMTMGLAIVSVRAGTWREIHQTGSNEFYWPIKWLPDSSELIVGIASMTRRTATEFFAIDAMNGTKRALSLGLNRWIESFAVHPSGEKIAYSGYRHRSEESYFQLWVVEDLLGGAQ